MIIDQTNIGIYKSLYQHKALTEKIIGFTDYALQYAVASYKAVCTEGVDFTMFDKVLCGILQIDDVSGFREIADILGLNVIHRPEDGKYIDFGEKEILEYAIKSLIDFNMVETDDIYYSRIRLTEIGKDYAKQGKKFLPATPKEFKIYFDLIDQKHQEAKKRFGKLIGVKQSRSLNFEINEEVFVKEIAKIQTPEIYNPQQLRNFTGLEWRGTEIFQVNFKVVGLVSIKDNSVRLIAYDNKQTINQAITDLIEENRTIKNEIITELVVKSVPSITNQKSDIQRLYENEIKAQQQEVEDLFSQNQAEKAFAKNKEAYLMSNIIEEAYFELNFKDFFTEDNTEIWLFFINFSKELRHEIEVLAKNSNPNSSLFVVLPTNISDDDENFFSDISDNAMNFYFDIIDFESMDTNFFLIKKNDCKKMVSEKPFLLNCKTENGWSHFEINAYIRTNEWSGEISEIQKQAKLLIADSYCEIVKDRHELLIDSIRKDPKLLTKRQVETLETNRRRLRVFRNEKKVSQWINDFYKSAKEKISALKELLTFRVEKELNEVEIRIFDEEANYSISELRGFEDKLQELRGNLYDENIEACNKVKTLEDFIKPKIQALSKLEKKLTPKPQNRKSISLKNKR